MVFESNTIFVPVNGTEAAPRPEFRMRVVIFVLLGCKKSSSFDSTHDNLFCLHRKKKIIDPLVHSGMVDDFGAKDFVHGGKSSGPRFVRKVDPFDGQRPIRKRGVLAHPQLAPKHVLEPIDDRAHVSLFDLQPHDGTTVGVQ